MATKCSKLRLQLIGQQAFGADVFKKLLTLKDNCEIVGVSAPQPTEKFVDPLWKAATEAAQGMQMYVCDTKSIGQSEDVKAKWKALDADLCVLAFVTDILPDEVLQHPKKGSIQYHPSLLPLHRGMRYREMKFGLYFFLKKKKTVRSIGQ